tara:strand:+ start:204 stop:482 length:279 start_codon:yes stop_codon:yes gene_type:complete
MAEKKPTWIGIEIPMTNTTIKVCIGINLDDGLGLPLDISFTTPEDIEACKGTPDSPWHYGNKNIGEIKVNVVEDNGLVFDEEHNLIDPKIIN